MTSESPPIAVLDANVLVSEWSRKLLQELAAEEPPRFVGIWSSAIIAETWRVLTVHRVNSGSTASRLSNDSFTMWTKLDPVLRIAEASRRPPNTPPSPLRDRHDEHLWNAALNAGAQYVVSHNTRHFPPAVVVEPSSGTSKEAIVRHLAHGIEFLTAIEFIEEVLGVDAAVRYKRPLPSDIVRSRRSG
jgi:hypothetical protein